MKKILYTLMVAFVATSCLKDAKESDFLDDAISGKISFRINLPEGKSTDLNGMVIKLSDASTGMKYEAVADANGEASVQVAYGSYIASTETKNTLSGGKIEIYNGATDRITITPKQNVIDNYPLNLNFSESGQIIIKEIYYNGCKNPETGKAYTLKDTYFSLYNNSADVAYLDSLCVGCVDPANAPANGKLSDWVKPGTSELRDSIPLAYMAWMFEGNGKDIPIAPGEEVIVCLNAIDHVPITSTSIDLSDPSYYAMYDGAITTLQSAPAPGVTTLKCFWKTGTSKSFVFSILSPGLFIYSLGGKSTDQFIKDAYSVNPNKPGSRNSDVLLVDKSLILDGVECFSAATQTKRMRSEIDNGFAMITGGSGSGKSIHRIIDQEATDKAQGRTVYMDTNNSTNDFEVLEHPTLKK